MKQRESKKNYSPKQRRQAHHIEQSEMDSGLPRKNSEKIGWATVNKQTGGASKKKSDKQ